MLRWARAQRSNKKLAPDKIAVAKKTQKEFTSLAFPSPGKADSRPASDSFESAPLTYVRKKRRVNLYVVGGSIALAFVVAALTGIFFGDIGERQPLLAPAEMTTAANNVLHSAAPETFVVAENELWAGGQIFTNDPTILPSVGFSQRIPLMALGQIAQIAEPEIQAVSPGAVAYSVPEAMKPEGIDGALVGINVPLLGKFAQPVSVSNPIASLDKSRQFAPPTQYSRQDLGSGVGDLFKLMTGHALTKSAESEVQTNLLVPSKPLISWQP